MNLWSHRFSQNMNCEKLSGFLPYSVLHYTGQKRWLHKFILKFTDLYDSILEFVLGFAIVNKGKFIGVEKRYSVVMLNILENNSPCRIIVIAYVSAGKRHMWIYIRSRSIKEKKAAKFWWLLSSCITTAIARESVVNVKRSGHIVSDYRKRS